MRVAVAVLAEIWRFEKKNVSLSSGLTSGSGWVTVVPLDRGDHGGSNGAKMRVAVAVLAELWWVEKKKCREKFFLAMLLVVGIVYLSSGQWLGGSGCLCCANTIFFFQSNI
jgi:hypothetical protein